MLCAVLPNHPLLDSEADAAAQVGIPVVRFVFSSSDTTLSVTSRTQHHYVGSDNTNNTNKNNKSENCCSSSHLLPCFGIFRGFMLSDERYEQLYSALLKDEHIQLTTTPSQYVRAHYFPNSYRDVMMEEAASSFRVPRACWCEVTDRSKNLAPSHFDTCVKLIQDEWANRKNSHAPPTKRSAATHVMLKDFVKSAKPHFLKVPIHTANNKHRSSPPLLLPPSSSSTSLQQQAVDFVHERGFAFNKGVVFKEHMPLSPTKNEWRLWFVFGELMSMNFNGEMSDELMMRRRWSPVEGGGEKTEEDDDEDGDERRVTHGIPRPDEEVIDAATRAAKRIDSPFITIDFALAAPGAFRASSSDSSDDDDADDSYPSSGHHDDGSDQQQCQERRRRRHEWVCLEVGDGGVSGPGVIQDLAVMWKQLKKRFEGKCQALGRFLNMTTNRSSSSRRGEETTETEPFVVNIHSKVKRP